jgi:ABC-2 type transport system ATP-binding protein
VNLDIQKVSKTFYAGKTSIPALNQVSLSLNSGEILGFVGANGAGKSTLMRIIMGVLDPDAGNIMIDDQPANIEARKKIGYMPSERGLYPKMKVREQLIWLGELKGVSKTEAASEVDELMGLLEIDEYKNSQLETLSTGNAQRVQLVAALVAKPQMLILDEPFSGLDPLAVRTMTSVLKRSADQGVGIMFSSHQLELIDQMSDRVAIIKLGQMQIVGTPDELRKAAHAPLTVTVPTPLADIFGELIKEEK